MINKPRKKKGAHRHPFDLRMIVCGLIVNEKMESATTVKALCVKIWGDENSWNIRRHEYRGRGPRLSSTNFEDSLYLDGNMYTVRLPWLTDGLNS
ncbi:hypothetical protein T12_3194 [Trichinella patagoniensis]|uniref:Uncharacterized protein n=1 Tax=Trichinella patagoniensis TaxID=990121 RepID=A0A0V0ZXP2_9BILA|nr:hypothetical protein T12_3194 [Trichinella patagoniensis]